MTLFQKVASQLVWCLSKWPGITAQHAMLVVGVLLAITLSACGGSVFGQQDSQSESSPVPGVAEFRTLAVTSTGGTLLTANETGIYRSPDTGQTWELITTPKDLDGQSIRGVLVNPGDPTMLYAWGEGMGVVRSDDNGATWQSVTNGLPADDVGALAMHSFNRETLYAWLEGHGVFRTKDGGQSWELMDEGPSVASVASLTHTPLEGSMNTGWLYASTPKGVYLSMDCF